MERKIITNPLKKILLKGCFLLSLAMFSTNVIAQITVDVSNKSIKEILKEIETKSEYRFFYNEGLKGLDKITTLRVKEATIDKTMSLLLDNTEINYKLEKNNLIVLVAKIKISHSESKKITGLVTDDKGEPIIGASVFLKGSNTGTITNVEGVFALEAPEQSNVTISYVGFNQTVLKVGKANHYKIILEEDSKALDEVIVVGYGTQKKLNLSGAVTQISGKDIESRPAANMSQLLQGIVPNMNITFSSGRPGASGSFNIRGNTSISGGSPLILIDGNEGSIDRLNPRDVESVSVLKDASASAVYGARASYGVILVTTKTGTENKMSVSYGGKIGFGAPTTSTDFETRGYYSAGINDLFFKSYSGLNYTKYTTQDYEELWIRRNDKTENPLRPWVVIDQRDGKPSYSYYANTDWYNYLYDDTRPTVEHSVNINGGNNKIKYFLSGSIYDQKGVIRINPDKFQTLNFRSKISANVKPWLEISNNTRYFRSDYTFPGYGSINNIFSAAVVHGLASIVPANPDGTPVYLTSLSNYQILNGYSALLTDGKDTNRDQTFEFSTTFEALFKIISGFDIHANYSYTSTNGQTMNRSANFPYSKYPGEILNITSDIGINQLSEKQANSWYQTANVYANFERQIAKLHNIKIMAGANYETKYLKDLSMSRQDLLTTDLNDFNLATGSVMNIAGGQNEYAIFGAFYRINYDYSGRYLFETSGRYDGTSRFMSGRRFGFFPSASFGWRVSEEPFFGPLKKSISNLKLRISYGSLGNQQVGYYDYIQTINTTGTLNYAFGDSQKASYATVSSPNASDLTWEKVSTRNLGIDMSLLDRHLDFSGDIYVRTTTGMLTAGKDLPAVYGANIPKENSADLQTNGWEIMLSWHDQFKIRNKPFNYNVKLSVGDYNSTITKYDNPSKLLSNYYVGQKLGDIWGYKIDGYFKTDAEAASYPVDQTAVNTIINSSAGSEKGLKAGDLKFVDINKDGVINTGANTADNPGDRMIIGNSQPKYTYGANFGMDWSGIDLSVFIQGIGKQNWYPGTECLPFWGPYARPYATFIPSDFLSKVWSETNTNAYFPRPRGYVALNNTNRSLGVINNKYLQDLAYCRLKNLCVGYSLPNAILSKIKIEKLRVYFSGENLFTFTKLVSDYIDPEQAASGGANGDAKVYGWSKTYSFGVDISF